MLNILVSLAAILAPCPTEDSWGCTFYQDDRAPMTFILTSDPADPVESGYVIDWTDWQ